MRLNHCQIFLFCHIQCSLICETLFNFCYHFFLFLLFLFVLNSAYGKYHNIKYLNITRFLSKCNGSLLEFCFQIYGIKQLWCFNLHYWERERLVLGYWWDLDFLSRNDKINRKYLHQYIPFYYRYFEIMVNMKITK